MTENPNPNFRVDPLDDGERTATEAMLREFENSVQRANRAAQQLTKDGVNLWRDMSTGEYQAEQAFKDAATLYARSVKAWRDVVMMWTGYSLPPHDHDEGK